MLGPGPSGRTSMSHRRRSRETQLLYALEEKRSDKEDTRYEARKTRCVSVRSVSGLADACEERYL